MNKFHIITGRQWKTQKKQELKLLLHKVSLWYS